MMNALKKYDSAIWVRVAGTFLTKVAQFMMYPFLVLYMTQKFDASVPLITAVIGLESIAGFIINLLLGGLSDRFGRKSIMMLSLAIQTICLISFAFVDSLLLFAVLITILGAGSYIFFPAADAQIADSVSVDIRAKVYAMIGSAASVGVAIGPLLGVIAFKQNPAFVFLFFACVTALYFLLVWWKIPETVQNSTEEQELGNKHLFKISLKKHRNLIYLTLLVIPTSLLSAQDWSTFPLYLQGKIENYEWVYSSLLSIGAIAAAVIQIWIAAIIERKDPRKMIFIGYMLAMIAAIGYALFIDYGFLIAIRLIMVVASSIYTVHLNKFISTWAPGDMRGRYFSIFGLHWRVSEAFGPFIGGVLLSSFNGSVMFGFFAALLFVSGFMQLKLLKNIR
ncbi:MDR family MFS transporter [Oceanobacillus neutriphilus]|uniref:MFS transporter n=1 Tax=Oceanobacillus neutriphilus TaxID=531815 RepID=A0ABQ2NUR6_9BACI|nr:MFS transporter [Oceanobacillus neutriphilus]GGP11008.1 MFS transporter [Oceanobacillus neutriphilus]